MTIRPAHQASNVHEGLEQPLVSIVLPLHNASDGLADALTRLSGLHYPATEIIAVDDGSTDATWEILEAHRRVETRLRPIRLPTNIGVARARNRGITAVTGEFVWFTDWDDLWDPFILDTLVGNALTHAADIAICAAKHVGINGRRGRKLDYVAEQTVTDGPGCLMLMLRRQVHGYLWTKLIRTPLLRPDQFPALSSQSDFAGLVDMVPRAGVVVLTPDILYWHLVRQGSITNRKEPNLENLIYCHDHMLDRAVALRPAPPEHLMTFFTCWARLLGPAQVAVRLGTPGEPTRATLRYASARLTWRRIGICFSYDRPLGVRALLIKVLGPWYLHAYRSILKLRSGMERGAGWMSCAMRAGALAK